MIATTLVTTNFPKVLIEEAFEKEQELKQIGQAKESLSMKQREILIWFSEDIERVKCLGYEDFYAMLRDTEIASALWGKEIVGAATRNRLIRLVDLQLLVPEIDLFSTLPRSVTSSPAMPILENEISMLPPRNDPARPKALGQLQARIVEISNTSWRDQIKAGQAAVKSEYHFDVKTKTILDSKNKPVLIIDEINPLTARLLVMVFHEKWDNVTIDQDNVVAWADGNPVNLGRLATQDKKHINMLISMLHAAR